MKSFAILALAGVVAAQSLTDLPACGQTCINNMLNLAPSLGCPPGDVVCYCTNTNFGYGVRDCSNEACSNQADAAKVISFGLAYCQSAVATAGASVTTGGAIPALTSALVTLTNTEAPAPTATGTGAVTDASGLSSLASDASSAVSSINSVAASLSESLASVASSLHASLSSVESSIHASASNALSSIHASQSDASEAASATNSAATGTHTGGAAPLMTGMPLAGAAGLAAWLLL